MKAIVELKQMVNERIGALQFEGHPSALYEPLNYMLGMGGKHLRPVLTLLGCEMAGTDAAKALEPAIGIELFHNFTLMHDDIMDKAPLRRGKATIHEKYNENTAILAGDVLFVYAYKYITSVDAAILPDVINTFNDTAIKVCEGQQMDMIFEEQKEVSIDDYLEMIKLKTAVLLGGALKIGAIAGGAEATIYDSLYDFGIYGGMAFQLQDDILDTFGDPDKFGKKVGGDIAQNKKTYLLLRAFEKANMETRSALGKYMQETDSSKKISGVLEIYDELEIKNEAEQLRNEYFNKALDILSAIDLPEDRKSILKDFAESLMWRDK